GPTSPASRPTGCRRSTSDPATPRCRTPPASTSPAPRSRAASPPWRPSWSALIAPDQRDDFAVDGHLFGPEDEVDHGRVGRAEHDLVALAGEGLDRGLLAGDAGDDDVALLGGGLLTDDDVVAVEDAGLDHGVAPHAEHEHRALAGEVGREREDLLHVLGGEDAGTGGDVTDERDVADG